MYRKAHIKDYPFISRLLKTAEEVNFNFMTLLLTQGVNNDQIETFVYEKNKKIVGAIAFFNHASHVYASEEEAYTMALPLLKERQLTGISGPFEGIDLLSKHLTHQRVWRTVVCRMDHLVALEMPELKRVEALTLETIEEKYTLQNQVFDIQVNPKTPLVKALLQAKILRGYLIKEAGKIVSVGDWICEHPRLGNIVGIATLPPYRGKHYARAITQVICQDIMDMGLVPVLRYDTPQAKTLYHHMGFYDVCEHGTLYF